MINDRIGITIPQEVKEDYQYVKSMAKGSQYSINWSQALEMLNQHIEQKFPERSVLTEEYIDCLMYAACFCNNYNLSAWLINNGADVNFQDHESGNTLLQLAALNGNTQLAKLLIDYGARLDYDHDNIKANLQGNTYLHLAAEGEYNEFIQFIEGEVALKSMSMNNIYYLVGYKNKEGNTALHLAAKNGYIKCVEQLLGCRDDKNKKSNSTYHCFDHYIVKIVIFLMYGSLLCSYLVIAIKASNSFLEMVENYGIPTLLFGCIFASIYIIASMYINFLKSQETEDNCSLSARTNNNKETALHLAIKNLQEEDDQNQYYQCAQLLIEATPQLKINAQDKEGNTALHLAAEKGFVKSVELLLNKKADAKIMTDNKKTALHLAIENSHYDCARHIVKYMAEVEKKGGMWKSILYKLTMIQNQKNWEKEALSLVLKQKPKDDYNKALWYRKRELIFELLKITSESEIDEVYSCAKNYAERKDGDDILRAFDSFFRQHKRYKDKNLTKLRKQESWNKDYALYCANTSLTIVAIFFLLKQSFDFSKNGTFVYIENKAMIIAKVISIFSFCLAIGLYFKHKELDKIEDYQDKIDEISDLLTKKAKGSSSNKPEELCFDAEEACTSQQQRKSSYTFSKSELPIFKPRKVYSDDQLELVPLLPPRLIETRRSLPSEQPNKLIQTYQSITEQSSTLDIELISEPECRKTLDRKLIKNPSFYELETRL